MSIAKGAVHGVASMVVVVLGAVLANAIIAYCTFEIQVAERSDDPLATAKCTSGA